MLTSEAAVTWRKDGFVETVQDVRFSPTRSELASAHGRGAVVVYVWNITDDECRSLDGGDDVDVEPGRGITKLRWSRDGTYLAGESASGRLYIWHVSSGLCTTLEGASEPEWAPQRNRIAVFDGTSRAIRVWDVDATEGLPPEVSPVHSFHSGSFSPAGIRWSPDGSRIARCHTIWNLENDDDTGLQLESRIDGWKTLCWHPDALADCIVIGGGRVVDALAPGAEWASPGQLNDPFDFDAEYGLSLCKTRDGSERDVMRGFEQPVYKAKFSPAGPNGVFLAALDGRGTEFIRVFDGTGEELGQIPTRSYSHTFDWSPTGDQIAGTFDETLLRIWNIPGGVAETTVPIGFKPRRVQWSQTGDGVLVFDENTIAVIS